MIRQNGIQADDVGTALFTTSPDLTAEFPALAARQLGWLNVPMMCGHEMSVPGSLQRCVRVLLNWNTEHSPQEIKHVYIKDAVQLRPDLSKLPPVDWDELEAWIAGHCAAQAPGREMMFYVYVYLLPLAVLAIAGGLGIGSALVARCAARDDRGSRSGSSPAGSFDAVCRPAHAGPLAVGLCPGQFIAAAGSRRCSCCSGWGCCCCWPGWC